MNYQCPVCKKVWKDTMSLARHMLGTGDKAHREWIDSKGLSFSNLMIMQSTEPGNKGYKTLSDLLEKEAPKIE